MMRSIYILIVIYLLWNMRQQMYRIYAKRTIDLYLGRGNHRVQVGRHDGMNYPRHAVLLIYAKTFNAA